MNTPAQINLKDLIFKIANDGAERARKLTTEQREELDRLAMRSFRAETAEEWADICAHEAAIMETAGHSPPPEPVCAISEPKRITVRGPGRKGEIWWEVAVSNGRAFAFETLGAAMKFCREHRREPRS